MNKLLSRLFGFDAGVTTIRTEIIAGFTTFLTMAYILAVNPAVMSETGMDKGALFTMTALVSALATLLMATIGKLPFALAPGMGLNAFFCLHYLCRSWLFVAICTHGCIYRGFDFYLTYNHQFARSYFEVLHKTKIQSGINGIYRYVQILHHV